MNNNENPELILEKLKSLSIHDEKNTSLDTSYHTIMKILTDYKFYKDIVKNNNNRKSAINIFHNKFKSEHEYSKYELTNLNGIYNKNVFSDVNHKLERIKKWVKMAKSCYLNNNEDSHSFISDEDNVNENNYNDNNVNRNYKNIKSSNNIRSLKKLHSNNYKSNDKNIIIGNYTDKKIENGITQFCFKQNSKFIERVKKGPPDCFRWTSWCIVNNLPMERNDLIYENYTNMSLEKENKERIIRDIERTFSERNIEKEELRKMEISLYKVLKAFWNVDKIVGYCQGMNLLVGFLLILSDFNERDTFFILLSNFSQTFKLRKKYEFNFRGLFSEEFPLLGFLNFIFQILLEQYANDLKSHLDEMGMTIDLWMGKWFQTVFTIILPIDWCKRLWDNIFAENIFFMVKFGIAFTLMIKDDLLKMEEEEQIIYYFKEFEKYSLCEKNDFLNEKSDIYSIILKSKKIKLDVESLMKNYEKNNENGKGFYDKMKKVEDIKYQFYNNIVSKPTIQTILFSEEDNVNKVSSIKNRNSIIFNSLLDTEENKIIKKDNKNLNIEKENEKNNFEKHKEEVENVIHLRKNNRINNLNVLPKKNSIGSSSHARKRMMSFDFSNAKDNLLSDRKPKISEFTYENLINDKIDKNKENNKDNNINNDDNNIINHSSNSSSSNNNKDNDNNNNDINNINSQINDINNNRVINNINNVNVNIIKRNDNNEINNINITEDSINNTYYQNIEENISTEKQDNIIKNNIESHQFEKLVNRNKLDYITIKNKILKTEIKNSDFCLSPTLRGKKESMGIHIPKGNDVSSFIGKNKFSKLIQTFNKNNNKSTILGQNLGIIFNKEK